MIDRETVRNVAKLARLGMTEEDLDTFGQQLSVILENIAILQEADVSGISPTAHASRLNSIMRADVAAAIVSAGGTACERPRAGRQRAEGQRRAGGRIGYYDRII